LLAAPDWSFARRPFWLFSHAFVLVIVVLFVFFGFWQLGRHFDRVDGNSMAEERANPPALAVADITVEEDPAELELQLVEGRGEYLEDQVVQVANRTQGGVAGRYVVGLFQLDDGRRLLVNRGFVPLTGNINVDPAPEGPTEVRGWLRLSVTKGWLGPTDPGEGEVVPRLDIDAIEGRLDRPVEDVWLQLADDDTGETRFPDPVPLPPLDAGPHLGYMGQWFIFALLGSGFYVVLLRRNARRAVEVEAVPV
jgi:surfeit locus 1 family protein